MGQHSTDNYNEFFLLGICSFPNARRENGGDNWWKKGVVLVFFNVMNLTLECLRISVFMYSKRPRDQEWRGKHGSILISRLFFETFFYLFKGWVLPRIKKIATVCFVYFKCQIKETYLLYHNFWYFNPLYLCNLRFLLFLAMKSSRLNIRIKFFDMSKVYTITLQRYCCLKKEDIWLLLTSYDGSCYNYS